VRASKKPAGSASTPARSVLDGTLLARTILLALLAIAGATWALVRHSAYQPPPLHVARPPAAGSDDAGDLPAPDLLED